MEQSAASGRFMSAIESTAQDVRYALRTLRRDAGFTTFAILIVGLGIGASTIVFSVINTLLVRPLPFKDAGRLVWITNSDSVSLSGRTTQVGHLLDLREQNRSFSDLAAYFAFYGTGDSLLTGQGEPERLSGVPVSDNFFQVLGIQPVIGRLFTPEECKWNGPRAVLLSHGLWVRRFGSDPAVAGRSLIINGEVVTVAGVLPASFDFGAVFAPGSHFDLYFPFPLSDETNRWGNTMAIIGRLKPGVTIGQAQAELTILAQHITQAHPERNSFGGRITPLAEHVSGGLRLPLAVLAGAVAAVMLIVCANLSNLLLARAAVRQKEIAVRIAVGAGRRRLARQMLTEGLTLSAGGAVLGTALAIAGTHALTRLEAVSVPLLRNVRVDVTALAFTLATALLTGIVFGLVPMLQVPAATLHDVLKDSTRGSTAGRGRGSVRSALVVAEIAFACVLLVGAGLLIRSFLRVLDVNLGFQPSHAAALRVDPERRPSSQEQLNAYLDDVLRRARSAPGVEAAGITDALPLGRNRSWGVPVIGQVYARGQVPSAFVRIVTDGYIGAMGIPIREGRDIDERDVPSSTPVIVINETMARTLFPGHSALGKRLGACEQPRTIVGVVGDVRHLALEQGAGMEMYLPMRQCGDAASLDLVVRTRIPTAELAPAIRGALKPVAPNLPRTDFRPLQQLVDRSVSPRRFVVTLLGGFAAFALVLASLGIYGVVSYSLSQRTKEIGIRMALGASPANVRAAIFKQTLALAAVGLLLGSAGAWVVARALGGLLYGVTSSDPFTFFGMLMVLASAAMLASYFPARRATRVDPVIALHTT